MIRVRLPGTLEYRDLAMRLVASACKLVSAKRVDRQTGATRPDASFDDEVISAFGEAFNNVALHSYAGTVGDIDIEIEMTAEELIIQIRDHGASFDMSSIQPPDLEALQESGFGIFIMRSCMDGVKYDKGTPNVLTMTKRLVREDDRPEELPAARAAGADSKP